MDWIQFMDWILNLEDFIIRTSISIILVCLPMFNEIEVRVCPARLRALFVVGSGKHSARIFVSLCGRLGLLLGLREMAKKKKAAKKKGAAGGAAKAKAGKAKTNPLLGVGVPRFG